ncbi:MAG TPA: outer membrane beta-barrel protein [Candidatus Acidoferrales bacterium]|nr:outer membrane beta-barrel protein [Candidatus Acidoferrales bacterium]
MTFRPGTISLILLSLACISIVIAPSAAHAQDRYPPSYPQRYPPRYPERSRTSSTRFTFSPFVGTRFGGRIAINTPTVDYLSIHNSLDWGFNAGVAIVPHLFGEFMWNRQTTGLSAHHVPAGNMVTLTNNAHLDLYQFSLLYEFTTRSQLRPFVVAGIGAEHFDSHGILGFSDRFAYNVGGGVKYLLTPQIALRGEMRWSPSRTTSSSTVFCDPSLGCFTTPITNHAEQGQANIGLEFRF